MTNSILSVTEYRPFAPAAETLWEPVWKLRVQLTPCERELLNTWPLRRLGFVHTFGAGGLVMPTRHSRLSHIQGVFALSAYFHPHDELLRLAALLHDIGHGPFSHSAEALPGFDHHQAGREIILGEEIGGLLHHYGYDPLQIVALTEGLPPNPVRTQNGLLHLDHLDFFIRDPFICGWHIPLPVELLPRLYLNGPNVAADLATAEHLVERILFEHRLFTVPAKIAAEAVLERLFMLGSQRGIFSSAPQDITGLTDAAVLARLEQADDLEITAWLDRLLRRPHTLSVRRFGPDEAPPADGLIARFEKPYVNQPLVDGRPVGEVSDKAAAMLKEAQALLGTFVVDFL